MKRSLKNLTDYTVHSNDGMKGKVKDFLFDDEGWIIRYLETDFGSHIKGKRVLIPAVFLNNPDWENKVLPVNLKKENIEACPGPDEASPVSREYEKQIYSFYNIEYYWPFLYTPPAGTGVSYPPRPVKTPARIADEENLDTSLRSFREVKGYYINASDGRIGHVNDIIIDDDDWQLVYLIIDTKNWVPWSREVILSVDILDEIDFIRSEVSVALTKDNIKEAPEFDPGHPIDMDYEKALNKYYKDILQ
ncbi:MAG: PRC-barrel domain-containing protein [Bacteroidales bacterium]|nr:PRC-barrel domain-containing protein [Bacteroidales bacterium]